MFGKKAVLSLCLLFCLLAFAACASANTGGGAAAPRSSGGGLPDWVRDPYTKYDKQSNFAARGSGSNLQAAEKSALGNLVAIFGQSIIVDEKTSTSFSNAVSNGILASWSENTSGDTTISTAASMDSLVGAEIGDTWYDGNKEYYAVAVLNKTKALQVYSNMIKANQTMIENLVNMPAADKNSLEGVARYQFAAMIADVTVTYGNVLSQIAPGLVQGLKNGDQYRLEAQNITKTIPIGLTVTNDKSGRIQGAFAKSLSELGFRSGGNNSRYVLQVNITVSPVELANNPNKFARMELSANLTDTSLGSVLLPYSYNNREGHTSLPEAENRLYLTAERKIDEEYTRLLSNYLSQLLPKKR